MYFSQLGSELGPPPPPPEKVKSKKKKKKKLSDFGPPLLRIPGHAPAYCTYKIHLLLVYYMYDLKSLLEMSLRDLSTYI